MSKRRESLVRKMREIGSVLKGSLAEVEVTCGTPTCRCHGKGPKHKGYYFSYRLKGKSHTVYVPKGKVAQAKQAHENWLELKRILEELTALEVKEYRKPKKGRQTD